MDKILLVPGAFVTYEDFGRRFFEQAVTEDRVAAAFAEIAGGGGHCRRRP